MSYIDPHPIRRWQIDERWSLKLKKAREWIKAGEKYGHSNGLSYLDIPVMDVEKHEIPDFYSFQAKTYKFGLTLQEYLYYLDFWDHHRQIFSLDPYLAEALAHTDIGDVPWNEIRLTHPYFYVGWGNFGQESFCISEPKREYVVDGAYIKHIKNEGVLFPKDTLQIIFTTQLVYPSYSQAKAELNKLGKDLKLIFGEPQYEYLISGKDAVTVGDAIVRGEDMFRKYCTHMDKNLRENCLAQAPEMNIIPDLQPFTPNLDRFERGISVFRNFIPLLFNAIFYLTERPEHREEKHSPNAPQEQIRQLANVKKETTQEHIKHELLKRGYSIITFVRDPEIKEATQGLPSDRIVRAHWRRGHWRNQRYGKGLTERKWLWIKPVLVKKDLEFQVGTLHKVPSINDADGDK